MKKRFGSMVTLAMLGMIIGGCSDSGGTDSADANGGTSDAPIDGGKGTGTNASDGTDATDGTGDTDATGGTGGTDATGETVGADATGGFEMGDWDPTDYSSFDPKYNMLDEYSANTKPASVFPEFSWDRVPRWLALRSPTPLSDEEIETIAGHYQLVMLEKANHQGMDSINEGIESVTTRLKAANPDIKTIFYWNTYIQYEGYLEDAEFAANEDDWSKKDEDGEIDWFKDIYNLFDQTNADLREWWIDVPLRMAERGIVDGVFLDKCGGFASGPTFDADGEFVSDYKRMVYELFQQMPEDKIFMGNILRNALDNAGRSPMEYMDGSYLERWAFRNRNVSNQQTDADAITMSMQLMREALMKGKMINFQTGMEYTDIPRDAPDWEARAQDAVHFPLAVFLIIAEKNAYFSYQHGVNATNPNSASVIWETSFIEEFNRPLGPPLGPPTKDGYYYTRSYRYLDVTVNIATEETTFDWKTP